MDGWTEKQRMKGEEEQNVTSVEEGPEASLRGQSTASSGAIFNDNSDRMNQDQNGSSSPSPSSMTSDVANTGDNKAKSCKGCLYYSSRFKANSRNPLCVGVTRSIPNVPKYMVGQSEMEASKEGRNLTDFRYGCVGYSLYMDQKKQVSNAQGAHTELPVCVGLEVLVDRRLNATDSVSTPAHANPREDGNGLPHRRSHKPAHSTGDEFLGRFARNGYLVANAVAKNARKVGNQIKQSLDDILYPYRRRPK